MRDIIGELTRQPAEIQQQFLNTLRDADRELFLQIIAANEPWTDLPDLEPHQLIDNEETAQIILYMAGRGAGKTFKGARWAAKKAEIDCPGQDGVLIAPTFQQVREVMVEGRGSGILEMLGGRVEKYNRSTFEITTASGSSIFMRSADRPDTIRGLNLAWAWTDEIGAWTKSAAWHEGLMPAMRIGANPQIMATTTPRRIRLVKELVRRFQDGDETIALGTGTTFDNPHLSEFAKVQLQEIYGDTEIGQQELYGKLIDTIVGSIWKREWIQRCLPTQITGEGGIAEILLGVDPSGSVEGTGDECGIIVAARSHAGNGYILADLTLHGSPGEWAKAIVEGFHRLYGQDHAGPWKPTRVCIEGDGNMGGLAKELLAHLAPNVPVDLVWTRGVSKEDRARPISTLWEQGRVFHVGDEDAFEHLEDEQTSWVPGVKNEAGKQYSPNRIDAVTWAMTALFPAFGFNAKVIQTNDNRQKGRGR